MKKNFRNEESTDVFVDRITGGFNAFETFSILVKKNLS